MKLSRWFWFFPALMALDAAMRAWVLCAAWSPQCHGLDLPMFSKGVQRPDIMAAFLALDAAVLLALNLPALRTPRAFRILGGLLIGFGIIHLLVIQFYYSINLVGMPLIWIFLGRELRAAGADSAVAGEARAAKQE